MGDTVVGTLAQLESESRGDADAILHAVFHGVTRIVIVAATDIIATVVAAGATVAIAGNC